MAIAQKQVPGPVRPRKEGAQKMTNARTLAPTTSMSMRVIIALRKGTRALTRAVASISCGVEQVLTARFAVVHPGVQHVQ